MTTLLIVLQVFIIALLVLVILLQKTSADGLSGLAGGGSGIVSGRAVGNFFTKLTAILAAAFMLNSLILAKIESSKALQGKNLLDKVIESSINTEVQVPARQDEVVSGIENTTKEKAIPQVPPAE